MLVTWSNDRQLVLALDAVVRVQGIPDSMVYRATTLKDISQLLPQASLVVLDFETCRVRADDLEEFFRLAVQYDVRLLLVLTYQPTVDDVFTAFLGGRHRQSELVARDRARTETYWMQQLALTAVGRVSDELAFRWDVSFLDYMAGLDVGNVYHTALISTAASASVGALARAMSFSLRVTTAPSIKAMRTSMRGISGPPPHQLLVLCRLLLVSRMRDLGWTAERAAHSLTFANARLWRRSLMQCTHFGSLGWADIGTDALLDRSAHLLSTVDCTVDFFARLHDRGDTSR